MANETRAKHDRESTDDRIVQRTEGQNDLRRWDTDRYSWGPAALMRQMQGELDRWFGRLGWGGQSSPSMWMSRAANQLGDWSPAIDAFQRGNEFVIRADVPGMTRNDFTVEVGDDALTIRGERKHDRQDERDGVFWSERSHGTFTRVIPLPPGAISDSAKANFHNGVLEVVLQAPSQETRRGRRVDITAHEGATKK